MGIARLRRLAGDITVKGTVRREPRERIRCCQCGVELAAWEGSGMCGRCATVARNIAETGSAHRRLINRPKRRIRRTRGGTA
jgi:NMD protein affecting ribosome stability and mRNA decay